MDLLTNKHKEHISGTLSCLDRVIITGTLPQVCHSQGMTSYLYCSGVRIFDYPQFAEPFKEELRTNAEQLAKDNGIEIEFVAKSHIRKEDLVQKALKQRVPHPTGLVHILSAMEAEKLIQSSMNIIDWNSPDTIIARSELYLRDGFPVKTPYSSNRTKLFSYRILRNHVAHNSSVSLKNYMKVLRAYYGTNPLTIPSVGEYLLLNSNINQHNYNLLDFFDTLEDMANRLK